MPYQFPDKVPDTIKTLPPAAQKIWIAVFNKVLDADGDERKANIQAWAAVRKSYMPGPDDKTWIKRESAGDSALVLLEALGPIPPAWIRILAMGENKLADGRPPFVVDKGSARKIVQAWKDRGNDLVVDYEHSTMKNKGEAPAAGWIKELEARSDGIWARVEWTDKAKDYIEKREYRYFSPVVALTEGRRVKELLNVALTNFPALAGLTALAAKYGDLDVEILGASEKDKAAQEARAKKWKIGIKPGGAVTKPSEWAQVPDEQFADPVNYSYPMPDVDQTVTAWKYWSKAENQKPYTPEERKIITERILARGRHFGKELHSQKEGATSGGINMINQVKQILGLVESASDLEVVLALKALADKANSVDGLRTQVEQATDRATQAENKATKAEERVTELEALSNQVRMPMMLTGALELAADATVEAALAKIESLKVLIADGDQAKKDLVALKSLNNKERAETAIERYSRLGRTSPAELAKDDNRLYKLAFDNFELFKVQMESRPDGLMAPVGQNLKVDRDDKGQVVILTAEDKEMCRITGVKEDDYLKAKAEIQGQQIQAATGA